MSEHIIVGRLDGFSSCVPRGVYRTRTLIHVLRKLKGLASERAHYIRNEQYSSDFEYITQSRHKAVWFCAGALLLSLIYLLIFY